MILCHNIRPYSSLFVPSEGRTRVSYSSLFVPHSSLVPRGRGAFRVANIRPSFPPLRGERDELVGAAPGQIFWVGVVGSGFVPGSGAEGRTRKQGTRDELK